MLIFHVLLAIVTCLIFMVLGNYFGWKLFVRGLIYSIEQGMNDAKTMPNDGVMRQNVRTDTQVLAALVAACSSAWKHSEQEPINFLRLQFEAPDCNEFGTWYVIIHKREDYNPFDHIEEQRKLS